MDIRESVRAGRPSFGIWSASGSPLVTEMAAAAGVDWVLLDAQHGAVEDTALLALLHAAAVGGAPALVRVGSDDPRLIMRALDLGAAGVVVPLVSTPAQAEAAVAATRYPPRGTRSFGPVRSFYQVGSAQEPLCLVMIETAEGVENVEEIAATPGLDGIFLGPVDLALDLGFGLADLADLGVVREPLARMVAAAAKHDIIAGSASLSPAMGEQLLEIGFTLLPVGVDIGHVRSGLAADRARGEEWTTRFSRTTGEQAR